MALSDEELLAAAQEKMAETRAVYEAFDAADHPMRNGLAELHAKQRALTEEIMGRYREIDRAQSEAVGEKTERAIIALYNAEDDMNPTAWLLDQGYVPEMNEDDREILERYLSKE